MYTCHQHTKNQFLPCEKVNYTHAYVFIHSTKYWVALHVRGLHLSSPVLPPPEREEPLLPVAEEEAGVTQLNSGKALWLQSSRSPTPLCKVGCIRG